VVQVGREAREGDGRGIVGGVGQDHQRAPPRVQERAQRADHGRRALAGVHGCASRGAHGEDAEVPGVGSVAVAAPDPRDQPRAGRAADDQGDGGPGPRREGEEGADGGRSGRRPLRPGEHGSRDRAERGARRACDHDRVAAQARAREADDGGHHAVVGRARAVPERTGPRGPERQPQLRRGRHPEDDLRQGEQAVVPHRGRARPRRRSGREDEEGGGRREVLGA